MAKQTNKSSTKKRGNPPPKSAKEETVVDTLAAYLPTLPLIDGEKREDYEAFHASCIRAIKPADAVETVWLQDFIDYTWEAQRLRKMKAALIQAKKREAVERLIMDFGERKVINYKADPLSREWSSGDQVAVEFVETLFNAHGLGDTSVMAKAVESCLTTLERIDKLIATYNYRRDAALRELEKRRDLLAKRARDFAENMLPDADVITVETTE